MSGKIHWNNFLPRHSIFLVEFSGNIGRNSFLTSKASQKIFRPYFQKSRLEYYFLCLFYFSSPFSGHLRSDFVVLLFLMTARSRRTRKADQKCPGKQDKKSKRDMKRSFQHISFTASLFSIKGYWQQWHTRLRNYHNSHIWLACK